MRGLTGLQTLATLPSPRADAPITLPCRRHPERGRNRGGGSRSVEPLDAIKDDWPFRLLRIAVKHHLEAAPNESATIWRRCAR